MRMRLLLACAVVGVGCMTASGQMGVPVPAAAAGTPVEPSAALNVMLTVYEHDAMGVVKTMPAEKYGFAPSSAIFAPGQGAEFATVRTFAQQVAHVAQANYYFFSLVSGQKPDADVKAIGSMTKKDDLVAAFAGSIAFGHKALHSITAANAFDTIKGADGMNTRATLAAFAVAHGYDHYGQMAEYLRMNGLVPPSSAPSK